MWHAQPLERGCRRVWQPPLPAIYRTIRPLYLASRLAPRLPRIYIAPFRPQFTSGYQVLAGERRACKFMRDAVHCFRQEVEKRGWKSRERREDRSRPLQRGRDTGGTKKEKAFLLPCHTCCSTIRKIRRIPRMEIVLAIDLEEDLRLVLQFYVSRAFLLSWNIRCTRKNRASSNLLNDKIPRLFNTTK